MMERSSFLLLTEVLSAGGSAVVHHGNIHLKWPILPSAAHLRAFLSPNVAHLQFSFHSLIVSDLLNRNPLAHIRAGVLFFLRGNKEVPEITPQIGHIPLTQRRVGCSLLFRRRRYVFTL